MNRKARINRILAVVGTAALAVAVLAGPATATPKDDSGQHTVTICHVTNSDSNPFVILEVDAAAFDGEGNNDHTQHVNNAGMADMYYVDGECVPELPTDPPSDPDDGNT